MTFPGDPREPRQPSHAGPGDSYSTSWRQAPQPQYGPPAASVPPPISGPGYPLQNPWFQTVTPPPKKKHTVRNVLLATLAVLVALCGIGTIIAVATDSGRAGLSAATTPHTYYSDCPFAAGGCPGSATQAAATSAAAAPAAQTTTAAPAKAPTTKAPAPPTTKAPAPPAAPQLTAAQQQAKGKAQDYLRLTHFSRGGLIDQLKFEGFSEADATVGVDAIGVDWNAQAAGKAKDYLSLTHFSHSGLVDQLKFDGFTAAQAEYGVTAAGL